jgi:2-keto-3-deoxy-L-rhamnonate aldolase RhmA
MFEPINHLKRKLARGETTLGLWVGLESPAVTEIAVTLGLDWVVIDTEHGALDYKDVAAHLRATRHSTTTPLVRIPELGVGVVKRVLDLGAHGIIVPQVGDAREVADAVRFARYPPLGIRGVGGDRATLWGMGLAAQTAIADRETMVIPLIETAAAHQDLEAILSVPGVDAVQVGPADYSASAGHLGQWEGPGVAGAMLAIRDAAASRGLACGIMTTSLADARARRDQGFRMIGLGSDSGLLIRALKDAIDALKPGGDAGGQGQG